MTAGYSGTPLVAKLGIGEGDVVWAYDPPPDVWDLIGPLPAGATVSEEGPHDVAVLFAITREGLEGMAPGLLMAMPADGALWVAWPKASSGVPTDLSEQSLRDVFLPLGVVDNKVCAIDATWSGLRFVVRREHRASWPLASGLSGL